MHPLIDQISQNNPSILSVHLDGQEIYRGEFTQDGIKTIIDVPVNPIAAHRLLTVFFDDASTPSYSLNLADNLEPQRIE